MPKITSTTLVYKKINVNDFKFNHKLSVLVDSCKNKNVIPL